VVSGFFANLPDQPFSVECIGLKETVRDDDFNVGITPDVITLSAAEWLERGDVFR
jgi:hypothetical protein